MIGENVNINEQLAEDGPSPMSIQDAHNTCRNTMIMELVLTFLGLICLSGFFFVFYRVPFGGLIHLFMLIFTGIVFLRFNSKAISNFDKLQAAKAYFFIRIFFSFFNLLFFVYTALTAFGLGSLQAANHKAVDIIDVLVLVLLVFLIAGIPLFHSMWVFCTVKRLNDSLNV